MSYHSPIVVDPLLSTPQPDAQTAPQGNEGNGHLDTIIGLIRQTTGAESVLVQFQGDAPQAVALGLDCIEVALMQGCKRVGMLRAFAVEFLPGAQQVMKGFASLIVEQNALWAQAHLDSLTGALTRRAFADDLERAVAQYRRHDAPCSLIMFDLDHFKRVNDSHGHLAGDAVLRAVGRLVKRELRAEDRFGRLGGEEFGVLVAADVATATEIAERLRLAIASSKVEGFEEIRFTASLGVAGCDIEVDSVMALMSKADEHLYAAKKAGRDQVCASPSRLRAVPFG